MTEHSLIILHMMVQTIKSEIAMLENIFGVNAAFEATSKLASALQEIELLRRQKQ